ncbi:hypothetical protein B0H66DRAFT_476137 [Apodospora peruviana]|uniref:DHHA2 domain-containing protein n=1 Tax=Apodospora peruviana TaxID=516989 RepID=A0AAE0I3Z8_9PEZI|nr:hypothetical protein B0H66DRAFT_476137 [Apodospora peruviana]
MFPPPRASLQVFLTTAKKALSAPPAQRPHPLTFVIGNESADLDSLCSAVVLAYFRTHIPPYTLHIPLSNLPRSDLALRPELDAVLRPAGLSKDDLVTLTDLPKDGGLRPENTRWLLVDHNAPAAGELIGQLLATENAYIIGCVDHHADEGKVPHDLAGNDGPRVIEKSGSCMSLVVDHCRETWERLSSDAAGELDAQIAHVALGPILIDTNNLTSKDKTTDWDVEAVKFAESKLQRQQSCNRKGYFDEITRLKQDISGMSYRDIWRKDYKQWRDGDLSLGMSSVVQGFGYLIEEIGDKMELLRELKKWAEEQKVDIAVVMTAFSTPGQDGGFKRELLVWALNEDAAMVAEEFVEENGKKLGLESWKSGELDETTNGSWRMCWTQGRVENSRKQVAPLLREAMKSSSKL